MSSTRALLVCGAVLSLSFVAARGTTVSYTSQELLPTPAVEQERFGAAVAVSGDTAAVAAPYEGQDEGTVYVYVRDAGGWSVQQKITGIGYLYSYPGSRCVALDGDTLVIGSVTLLSQDLRGRVNVFVRAPGGTVWTHQAELPSPEAIPSSGYGAAVAVHGDRVVVGDLDSAEVFRRQGTTWSHEHGLTPASPERFDGFGSAVAIDEHAGGATVVVGAPWQGAAGAAYVFSGAGTTWAEQRFAPTQTSLDQMFGWSVGVSGDTVVIGHRGYDQPGFAAGAAQVIERGASGWQATRVLTASDAGAERRFGHAVAVEGDRIVVGAPSDYRAVPDVGKVYVFLRGVGGWPAHEDAAIVPTDPGTRTRGFGHCVDVSGETVAVGVNREDGEDFNGEAFVCEPGGAAPAGPSFVRPLVPSSDALVAGSRVTFTVAAAATGDPSAKAGADVTYEWHFGDGAMETAGPKVTHTYADPGTFSAFVRAIGADGGSTDSVVRTIHVHAPGVPFFDVTKASVALDFRRAGKDVIKLSGQMPLADGTALAGRVLEIDFGGVRQSFTLDGKGRAKSDASSARVSRPRSGVARFSAKLRGDHAATLASSGFANVTARDVDATTDITVTFGDTESATQQVLLYTAKQDRSGKAK